MTTHHPEPGTVASYPDSLDQPLDWHPAGEQPPAAAAHVMQQVIDGLHARDMFRGIPAPSSRRCDHCGQPARGEARIDDAIVCHTDPPFPDCYRLVTVYGERLGSRRADDAHRGVTNAARELAALVPPPLRIDTSEHMAEDTAYYNARGILLDRLNALGKAVA